MYIRLDIEVATEMKLSTANIRSVLFHTKLKKTVLSAQTVLQGPQNSGTENQSMYVCILSRNVYMYFFLLYVCMLCA